ncbi:hypothetical protein, partial [Pararhodospirillum oryzae]|uniref:hypothetical protein n=1 Tax=Pararhodospirillum oryzae TaxID=478448 RepID=UPI001C3F53D1
MVEQVEGKFRYRFPEGWQVVKWDETRFHKKYFNSFGGGSKAVDFIAFYEKEGELWLFECKDYRFHPREKTTTLYNEV